ncbi:ALG5 [Symbiodinium necroappetens]|uniref:dolichyl-phosphate beta-glucosyltransferase n=1 Tax=Symbiodinium necroappetens TaxID=1628268 RepID=A0A812RTD5_9DINO|nr:ALG5 [Symbiodinium necroappetens]
MGFSLPKLGLASAALSTAAPWLKGGRGSDRPRRAMEVLLSLGLFLLVAAAAAIFLLKPYFDWRASCDKSLESQVSRTSFQCVPGELIPPAWKAPEVTLSVIVPAYNEEYRVPQMLDETLTYLEGRGASSSFSYEIIVVDDGSSDNTYAAALSASTAASLRHGEVKIIQLLANRGKGFAVRAGMLAARGQLLLMADADGATSIRDLERLERSLGAKDDAPHMAFGSRHHLRQEALNKRAWYRNVLMVGFQFAVWLLVGGVINDTQCGFKLFKANAAKRIFASLHIYRWAFDIEVLILSQIFGQGVAEVPVTWVEMPGSKLNLLTGALTMLRDMMLVRVLYGFGFWQPSVA